MASEQELRTAIAAVKHGAIWDGLNGPTGVTKDEALEYAVVLADHVESQLGGA